MNYITSSMSNPEIIMELGKRFKEYRLTNRLTQKEAAEKAEKDKTWKIMLSV